MRKFLINVNGNSYEVEVEELTGAAGAYSGRPAAAPAIESAVSAAAPVKEEKSVPGAPQRMQTPEGATEVKSPLPGAILSISVSVGDQVSKGDLLLVIEAMKMENEIMAPESGTILSIAAVREMTVNTGDLLLVIG